MDPQEAHLLQKGAAGLKVLLRLAGETADAVGGKTDRPAAVGFTQLPHHLQVLGGGVGPAHPAQCGVAAALQAEVELGAELVHRGHPADALGGEHIGVQAAQPDALDALHRGAALDQLVQVGAGVGAVAGQGDGAEHRLPVAGGGQLAQLGQDALLGAAAHRAPRPRDDAVGAAAVAAVLHLDEGPGVGLEAVHRQLLEGLVPLVGLDGHDPLVPFQHLVDIAQNGPAVGGAADHVGLGHAGGRLGAGLGPAARHDGNSAGVLPLGLPQPLAAFLGTEIGHGAAVDDVDVGVLAVWHHGKAAALEQLFQRLGLVQVHLASKGIKTNTHGVSFL